MFVLEMSQVMQGENGEKGHDHVGLIGFGVRELEFYSKCNGHQPEGLG